MFKLYHKYMPGRVMLNVRLLSTFYLVVVLKDTSALKNKRETKILRLAINHFRNHTFLLTFSY